MRYMPGDWITPGADDKDTEVEVGEGEEMKKLSDMISPGQDVSAWMNEIIALERKADEAYARGRDDERARCMKIAHDVKIEGCVPAEHVGPFIAKMISKG
jgi:hypothetical protein